jgi:CubicO group peptidase (beta-lactamase class C family)
LVEQGKVRLDAPANQYLKRWRIPSEPPLDGNAVTVEHLLRHAGGLSVSGVNGVDVGLERPSLLEELQGRGPSRAAVTVISPPGNKHAYSGGGYGVLQMIVEDVTDKSFNQFVTDAVFKPLEMATATFEPTPQTLEHTAAPYPPNGEAWPLRVYPNQAAAGLYATVNDYAKFLAAHCGPNPGRSVLKPQTLESMYQPTAATPHYGLGYQLPPALPGGGLIVAHSGSNRGWRAQFILLPSEGLGIVVASNSDGGQARNATVALWGEVVKDMLASR